MSVLTDMKILLVDDNLANIEVAQQILEGAGYSQFLSTRDPETVEHLCEAWRPDLVLLDLHMPGTDGYRVLGRLRDRIREPEALPVLVVTADGTSEARHRALSMGARDFITKPLDQVELLLRVRNLLQTRNLQRELQERNLHLGESVSLRTIELEHARNDSLMVLASVAEFHDEDTHEHTQRVGRLAARIARAGGCPQPFVELIRDAAPLHDIGKVGIPREILLKPGPLTNEERQVMQRHVRIGAQILGSATSPVLQLAAEIARTHHERWDGGGYLAGLRGDAIPLAGRITAVADVYDALTHDRPYKVAWTPRQATTEIIANAGTHFDPDVVGIFASLDEAALDADGLLAAAA